MELRPQKTEKGFIIIPMNMQQCSGVFNSLAVCEYCNKIPKQGIYVPVLNMYFDEKCYERETVEYITLLHNTKKS